MSDLTDKEVREAALCLIAADAALCDEMTAERGVRPRLFVERGFQPARVGDGRHCGDCTKQPHSCIRCEVEQAEAQARVRYEE